MEMVILDKQRSKQFFRPKIVLIDDDPGFCAIMASYAAAKGLELDYYSSLLDLEYKGRPLDYSLAIVDYDLGSINGVEFMQYLPILFGDMPTILVSATHRQEDKGVPWPRCIREFIHKDCGPEEILDRARRHILVSVEPLHLENVAVV